MPAVFNDKNAWAVGNTVSSFSVSMSIGGGHGGLCAVADICLEDATTNVTSVTGVSWAGVPMTAAGAAVSAAQTNQGLLQAFVLPNPATGANTITVTVSGVTHYVKVMLSSYYNVDQTTPVRASSYQGTSGSTTSATTVGAAITSANGDITHSAGSDSSGGGTISSTNQTALNIDNTFGFFSNGADYASSVGASVTHTWTFSATCTGRMFYGFSLVFTPPMPTLTSQPMGTTINDNEYWYGWIVTNDDGTFTYQWQQFVGGAWSNIAGQTTRYYTGATRLHVADSGIQYRCQVTNANGTTTSDAATITVQTPRTGSAGDFNVSLIRRGWF